MILTDGARGRFCADKQFGKRRSDDFQRADSAGGSTVSSLDDVLFPSASSGTAYVTDAANNDVFGVSLTGLDLNAAIASIGSLHELVLVETTNRRCDAAADRRLSRSTAGCSGL